MQHGPMHPTGLTAKQRRGSWRPHQPLGLPALGLIGALLLAGLSQPVSADQSTATADPATMQDSVSSQDIPKSNCTSARDTATPPIHDPRDRVAAQLRSTIAQTEDPALRTKLSQAYLRYLGCTSPNT